MNLRMKLTTALTCVFVAASAMPASAGILGKKKVEPPAKLTPAQDALVNKAIVREAVVIKELKKRVPLVETYIQNMRPDPAMGQAPDSDVHFLARVNFGKVIGNTSYAADDHTPGAKGAGGIFKHSLGYITGLSKSLHLTYNDAGFVRLIVIDTAGTAGDAFDRAHYQFSFVRNDFLGTIKTSVFDVTPVHAGGGRFFGRVWIEQQAGNIVRYNGDLAGEQADISEYFHFDSWRTNVQEGLWLPTSVYIEETDPKSPSHVLKMKAINHIWGYALKTPSTTDTDTSLEVQGADDTSAQANDVSPLQAEREWVQQAEDNVLERLYTAGLIDAPSDFDTLLAQLANNILAYNQIPTSRPIKVRTLLTEPLESIAVGNTILLSKSLIDTTAVQTADGAQQMGNLNAVLAFQVAHIILGHHIDTKFAFSDRLLFPAESAFQKLPMSHTDADNIAAAKKAMELLSVKDLADGQQYFSLYLQQLKARAPGLKALTTPQIGDSLLKPDGTFYMQALVSKGPKLDNNDVKQQAAMPLAAFLRFDPWTDKVIQMHTTLEPLLSGRDKMPFEVTPVYLRLTYWQPPAAPPAPAAAAPAGDPAAAAAAPATSAPATPAADTSAAAPTQAPATTTPPQN